MCHSKESSLSASPSIPAGIDQSQVESTANLLIAALDLLSPTEECYRSIRPFLCLHLFGLCGINGVFRTTLRRECEKIRDDTCFKEWNTAVDLLPSGTLPVCESLSDDIDECSG